MVLELASSHLRDVHYGPMKFNPWLMPGVALFGLVGWIGVQKNSAKTLEKEIKAISERIRIVRAFGLPEKAEDTENAASLKPKKPQIDWQDIAAKMDEQRHGGMQDLRTMMRMQRLLLDLSAEELGVQLDEIAALDLADSARQQLQGMILGALTEKNPKMALERCGDAIGNEDSVMHWQLGHALQKWATKEPTAAVAWLDQQIASGKLMSKSLDGKSESLVRLETSLVSALLDSDSAAATARVAALSEAQREQFFQHGFFFDLKKDSEAAYARMVRDTMPAERVGEILANTAGRLVMAEQADFERVDDFITKAGASDDEKKSIVAEVMKKRISPAALKTEDIDKIRAWGLRHAPSVVDQATGEAIASSIWRGGDFKTASELALRYNESSPNDEVLAAFLKNNGLHHSAGEQARQLIDKIKDPALQEEIRNLPQFEN